MGVDGHSLTVKQWYSCNCIATAPCLFGLGLFYLALVRAQLAELLQQRLVRQEVDVLHVVVRLALPLHLLLRLPAGTVATNVLVNKGLETVLWSQVAKRPNRWTGAPTLTRA